MVHFRAREVLRRWQATEPIRVAIIGLGFGAEFIPIYQNYPGAEIYGDLPPRSQKGLDECGDR